MNDDRLRKLLRAALPPTTDGATRRDVWPSVAERLNETPRGSLIDAGLGIATAAALLMFPEWLLPLVFHL